MTYRMADIVEHFQYIDGELSCDGVSVLKMAEAEGSPLYIYSQSAIEHHFQVFDGAFSVPHITCFAVKSCSNINILKTLAKLGCGADIVSGGELYRAITAGMQSSKIVYSGVGKTAEEIDYALASDILLINIESQEELLHVEQRAKLMGKVARIAIRVNPDVDPKTHPYISTGLKKNKFGVDISDSDGMFEYAHKSPHLDMAGVGFHIGSQLTDISPFIDSLEKTKKLIQRLKEKGIALRYLDIGGGLGITYDDETPPHPDDFARAVEKSMEGENITLIFEPGRMIVGNTGILVTKVLYNKSNKGKKFIIVDAGMNDLARPSLYDAYHKIIPVVKGSGTECTVDVVGPICESGDFFARDRKMTSCESGYLAIMSSGAYGFSMASNYNTRPRAAEVLVKDNGWHLIRRRETFDDLIGPEVL